MDTTWQVYLQNQSNNYDNILKKRMQKKGYTKPDTAALGKHKQ